MSCFERCQIIWESTRSAWWNTLDYWSVWVGLILFGLVGGLSSLNSYHTPVFQEWSSNPLSAFDLADAWLPILALTMGLTTWIPILSVREDAWHTFPAGFALIFSITFCAKWLGHQSALINAGVGDSIWAILFGMIIANTIWRTEATTPRWFRIAQCVELYISISLVLLCIDFRSIGQILGPAVAVAWIDTPILFFGLTPIAYWVYRKYGHSQFPLEEMIILVGTTMICGSSAAVALKTVVASRQGNIHNLPIAISSIATIPAIVALPYVAQAIGFTNSTAGAWFGGCVDSTGAVLATASLYEGGSVDTRNSAAITKMLQNLLIAVFAIVVAVYWVRRQRSLTNNIEPPIPSGGNLSHIQGGEGERTPLLDTASMIIEEETELDQKIASWPLMLWQYTPKFVLGFIAVVILYNTTIPESQRGNAFNQLFGLSEWFSTASFVSIGLKIRFFELIKKLKDTGLMIGIYTIVQLLDILITGVIAFVFFQVI